MCEKCEEVVAQLDPEFLKLMQELEPAYRDLENRVSERIKDIFGLVPVDPETHEEVKNLSPEEQAETDRALQLIANTMGMATLLGWHSLSCIRNPEEAALQLPPMISSLNAAVSNVMAYMKVHGQTLN